MAIRQRHPTVYTENERRVILLKSHVVGEFICVAVGATVVGSINLLAPDGTEFSKGAQHGYFAFGGSTVLFLFQPGTVAFDGDLIVNSMQVRWGCLEHDTSMHRSRLRVHCHLDKLIHYYAPRCPAMPMSCSL